MLAGSGDSREALAEGVPSVGSRSGAGTGTGTGTGAGTRDAAGGMPYKQHSWATDSLASLSDGSDLDLDGSRLDLIHASSGQSGQ